MMEVTQDVVLEAIERLRRDVAMVALSTKPFDKVAYERLSDQHKLIVEAGEYLALGIYGVAVENFEKLSKGTNLSSRYSCTLMLIKEYIKKRSR